MSNRVSEKFQELDSRFGEQVDELIKKEARRLSFIVQDELWRGLIYQQKKVGTVVVRGSWQGKPTVLKLQGIRPSIEEAELIARFEKHSRSDRIRAPRVFHWESWEPSRGYGLMIMEEITAPPLYEKPWATPEERAAYADFYTEFRSRAVTAAWLVPDEREKSTEIFMRSRLESWRKLNAAADPARRLPSEKQEALVAACEKVITKIAPTAPIIFGHGHLGSDDIRVEAPGRYVLLSNFFWSWRPQWYDLAFNVWTGLMALWREDAPSTEHAERLVSEWLETYRQILETAADPNFERNFKFMLLERAVGSVLVDLVLAERIPGAEAKREAQQEMMYQYARVLIKELEVFQ